MMWHMYIIKITDSLIMAIIMDVNILCQYLVLDNSSSWDRLEKNHRLYIHATSTSEMKPQITITRVCAYDFVSVLLSEPSNLCACECVCATLIQVITSHSTAALNQLPTSACSKWTILERNTTKIISGLLVQSKSTALVVCRSIGQSVFVPAAEQSTLTTWVLNQFVSAAHYFPFM